jgi:hypothetical protein
MVGAHRRLCRARLEPAAALDAQPALLDVLAQERPRTPSVGEPRCAVGQHPARARGVAGGAVRVALQVVLVLRLGLPEPTDRVRSVTTLPGQRPDASTSAMGSSATRRCSSSREKLAQRDGLFPRLAHRLVPFLIAAWLGRFPSAPSPAPRPSRRPRPERGGCPSARGDRRFPSYLEETGRLLAADRGPRDTREHPPPPRPRHQGRQDPPGRVCRPADPLRPSGADSSAPTSPLSTGVPESGQQPNPTGGPRGRRRRLAATPGACCWTASGPSGPTRCPAEPVTPAESSGPSSPSAPAAGELWECGAGTVDWSRLRSSTGATGRPTCDHAVRSGLTAGPEAEELRSWTARRCRWQSLPAAPRRS